MTGPAVPAEDFTFSPEDTTHYVGILEAVVAVLAIKAGMNPETMMDNAIRDIASAAGLDTQDTDRLIAARWTGRNVQASVMAARSVDLSGIKQTPEAQAARASAPMPDFRQAARERRERQLQQAADQQQQSEPAS